MCQADLRQHTKHVVQRLHEVLAFACCHLISNVDYINHHIFFSSFVCGFNEVLPDGLVKSKCRCVVGLVVNAVCFQSVCIRLEHFLVVNWTPQLQGLVPPSHRNCDNHPENHPEFWLSLSLASSFIRTRYPQCLTQPRTEPHSEFASLSASWKSPALSQSHPAPITYPISIVSQPIKHQLYPNAAHLGQPRCCDVIDRRERVHPYPFATITSSITRPITLMVKSHLASIPVVRRFQTVSTTVHHSQNSWMWRSA
jgi:hypothetical protein